MDGSARSRPSSEAELVIVGAGPVGLYACYYAGFRGLETVVLETLPFPGGQIAAFYPEAEIFDAPGFPSVRGRDLAAALERQARRFGADVRFGREVQSIEPDGERLRIVAQLGDGRAASETITARAVLLTAGIGPFAAQRIKDPEIDRFEGRGLHYGEPDPESLRGRRVMILGGSAYAVETAVAASRSAADVVLVHRRDRLAPTAGGSDALAAARVRFLPFRDLVALEGDDAVRAAVLADRHSGDRETHPVDLVLPRFGVAARGDALGALGASSDGTLAVDSRMATTVRGIWAAGDVTAYPGKVKVLAAAFGEACTAINNIAHDVIPGASVFPGYSSHSRGAPRRKGG
jgi:ferredoxin/flavodoxin---NADP+ reductase